MQTFLIPEAKKREEKKNSKKRILPITIRRTPPPPPPRPDSSASGKLDTSLDTKLWETSEPMISFQVNKVFYVKQVFCCFSFVRACPSSIVCMFSTRIPPSSSPPPVKSKKRIWFIYSFPYITKKGGRKVFLFGLEHKKQFNFVCYISLDLFVPIIFMVSKYRRSQESGIVTGVGYSFKIDIQEHCKRKLTQFRTHSLAPKLDTLWRQTWGRNEATLLRLGINYIWWIVGDGQRRIIVCNKWWLISINNIMFTFGQIPLSPFQRP